MILDQNFKLKLTPLEKSLDQQSEIKIEHGSIPMKGKFRLNNHI